jgi:hypothetical protein
MFGGNGGPPGFTIGNPKYLKGPRGFSGFSGLDIPFRRSNGWPTKIMFTSLGIYVYTFARYVPLGINGMYFIPTIIWVGAVVNGVSITITIERGIAMEYNGTNFTNFVLKLEVFA